jgi:hypothetical protein
MYLNWKEGKKNVVYVISGRVIAVVSIKKPSLTMEKTLPNKGILEILIKERESLTFYIATNKLKP